jgi:branched-chain amino acid transport system permease protein
MADAIQVTINGIAVGLLYALLLLGILMVFHVSQVVNFAHGQFAMLGGIVSLNLYQSASLPLPLAIPLGLAAAALTAVFVERVLVRRLPRGVEGTDMILTLGVFLALMALADNVLQRGAPRRYPDLVRQSFTIGGAYVDGNTVVALVTGVVLFAAFFVVLRRTRLGLILRACADDPVMAEAAGWNVERIRTLTWAGAGVIAGVAGIFIAARIPVTSDYTVEPLIYAFAAGILGGLHRFVAPLIAAVALGLYANWFGALVSQGHRVPAIFGLLILLLSIAPATVLVGRQEARA